MPRTKNFVRCLRRFILVLLLLASTGLLLFNSAQMQSPLRRITNTSEASLNLNPSMSGDGRIVAFESTEDVASAGGVEAFRAIRANVAVEPPTFVQMGLSRAPAPSISQDGSRIAFASNADPLGTNADGNSEIFLHDDSKLIQVTNTSPGDIANRIANGNFLPSISDDGRFVAFSSNRNLSSQNGDGNLEIFIFDTVAGGFTQLTNASGIVGFTDAKMSGDGTSLAYIRDNGATPSVNRDLLLQNRTEASSLRTLATNAQKLAMTFGRAISDDGKRVVWSAETATNTSQVFLYDGRNNQTRQITALSSRVTEVPLHPTLNGNGTCIAFAARRSISGTGSNSDGSVELYTYEIPSSTFGRVTNTTSNDATADVLSSMNDDGSVIAFNFPRVLTGVSNEAMANNSEIYVKGTPPRPDFGTLNIVNGASFGHEPATTEAVAPDSVAVAFGTRLANTTQQSQKLPNGTFPTTVGGTTVTVNGRPAQIFFVSPTQVNFLVPPETELGFAEVIVTNPDGFPSRGTVAGLRAAPGIFTYTGDGLGEGVILNANTLQPGPFDPTSGNLRLIIFSTGVRNALQVSVTAGGRALTLESVIRSPDMPGFDEVHVLVPADLRGAGPVDVVIRADTRDSNPVEVTFVGDSSRDIVINEFLSDPPGSATTDLQGDANHDGTRDTGDDEFVELVNSTTHDINVSGYQVLTRGGAGTSDAVRFTFPSGTIVPGCSAIVIFGGGTFSPNDPLFGGAQVFKAPSGLSLINTVGVITLRDQSQGIVNLVSYGGSTGLNGNADQSLTRSPDVTGKFTLHQSASGASGASFSPGRRVNGTPFNVCQSVARTDVSPPSATINEGAHQQFTAQAFDANNQPIPGVIFFWESSNTTVATIDQNGLATGLSPGTTEIRASGRGVQSAAATLTVTPITRILTTIEVTPDPGTVPVTGTQQFTARGFDQFGNEMVELTFTWESTDTSIATVGANGLATGVNQGQTTIKTKSGSVTGTATLKVTASTVIVNEVLADPPDGVPAGDANHDGVRSASDDEFVELANSTGAAIDISGWTVHTHPTGSTTETIRHTFAAGTNLPSGEAIVVSGGGGPSFDPANAAFACAQVVKASSGSLSLTNSGLTVVVRNGSGSVVTQFSYGSSTGFSGDNDQSLTRSPDISGGFVQHLVASGVVGRFSPGTRVNGTPFGSCPPRLTSVTIAPSSTTIIVGQSTQFTAQAFDQFGRPMTGVTITFASDNTTVTTVDSVSTEPGTGVATATVTGQGAGTAHITAQANDGTTTVTRSQATLTVSTPTPVLTSITISPLSATIDIGQTQQFTGQALDQFGQPIGNVTITFASHNLTVATVDTVSPTSGTGSATATATGHANGSAEIRATADNGAGTTVTSPPATLTVEHFVNAGDVLISEFRTRGPGGTSDEFIEIYNPTSSTVPIGELKIIASNGTGGTSTRATITAGATLAPGCHYLIAHTSYTGSVSANQTYGTGITDDGGITIMRADSTTIIDQVGMSNGSAFKEGTPLTPLSTSVEQSYERKPGGTSGNGTDTNNNASDFFLNAGSSNPQNLASGCLNLNAADLAISKTDSPDPVVTGSNVTYTIVVTNKGIANAQFVVVSDDLPGNATFVSCGSTGGGVCGGSGNNRTVTFASLGSGASETITLVATATGAGGTTITNTATVSSSTNDPFPANNSAQTTTTVANPPSADLSISKAESPDPVAPGATLTYTLTVTNGGPDAAQPVVVTDNLSSAVTFVDCSSDQGGVCGGTSTVPTISFSSLANGATATITIHVTVSNTLTTGTVITNAASVTSTTADPTSGNNVDSEDTTARVPTPTVTSVEVSPSTATINRGRTQQFTATAFNGVTPVPGATFTWGSSNTNVATIDTNGLATGVGIGTTTITATSADGIGGSVSGTAMLTVQVPLVINEILADPPGSVATNLAGDSNRDGTRSDDDDEFVELLNNSNAAVNVSGVVVADATSNRFIFPANTTVAAGQAVIIFGGGSPPVSDPAFGGALIFTTTSLSLNNTADTVTVKLNVGGSDLVIDTHTYGSEANNNQSITQSPDAEVGSAGGSFVQHTTATNAAGRVFSPGTRADGTPFGSHAITRIEVLPATAAIDIAATQMFTGHAYSNVGGPEIEVKVSFIWDSSDPTKATVAPTTGQTTTATAIAAGSSTIRARAGNQQGTAALIVNAPTPALSINDVSQVETNGTTTFTFEVSLSSPAPAGGVTFDIATADGTAQDDNPATEDNDYVAQTVTGATILEGDSTYDFVVTVSGDSVVEPDETFFVNVTNVTGATAGDTQGQGTIQNDDSAVVADLGVIKTVDSATPVIGQNVVFTIVLNNLGPDTATGVQVTDLLPSGLGYISSTVSQGTYDNATGLWTAGSVNNAASATLTITARVQTQGAKTNTASITSGASDPNSVDNQSSVTFTPGLPQVVISQLYTAGGASSAVYNRDYIEIFNRGTMPINLSGFSVQYAATGTGTFTVIASLPNVPLQPRQYFLITAGTTNTSVGANLPVPADVTGTNTNMTGSVGKVAIVFGTTALTSSNVNNPPLTVGNATPGCPTNQNIVVDFVGYGTTASCYEGTSRAPDPTVTNNSQSDFRTNNGCTDTNNNGADFTRANALPRNSSTTKATCP